MSTLIIAEKASQAKDLRAALGGRFGAVLAAEGHLLRLAEPEEVDPDWKRWSCALLRPDGLYPTRPDRQGNKARKLEAIAAALRGCDRVILATDCDREGQLIGQEILEHLGYRGAVQRALFTAQDATTIRQAFDRLKPNGEMLPLYQAAVARQQADQIFNLSLTRTATRTLLTPGSRGVIGIGRVKTPTLAIVCLREIEIRDFRPEDYFEVVATATVAAGSFAMRHAPAAKDRITDRARADAIARAAAGHNGPLTVRVENRRQAPPRLFDLPALQKTCGQRWGWTADRTLAVAQELYDGSGKKLITYPRAEARHLAESQIADVPAIAAALTRLRGFAGLDVAQPVIRRGKSGHFCDAALAGVAHHAIVPNVNVLDDLETRLTRLDEDEKRLFALICRSYLAAIMPDFEYRQTVATMVVPVPGAPAATFRAVGRIPLRLGWKAVFGSADADNAPPPGGGASAADEGSAGPTLLPALTDGEAATLSDAQVEAKRTQPPPRYSEGTLIDAMQNAWRFVEDPLLRERLKEAKGIGTPATRASIITGLKAQRLLAAEGKMVVPTAAGLDLFALLRAAAPALVDPGTTALWEMRLDDVTTGQADFRSVIDSIAGEAGRLIDVLQGHAGGRVDLGLGAATRHRAATPGRRRGGSSFTRSPGTAPVDAVAKATPVRRRRAAASPRKPAAAAENGAPVSNAPATPRRGRRRQAAVVVPAPLVAAEPVVEASPAAQGGTAPTPRMLAFALALARQRGVALPPGLDRDFALCRRFLDQYASPSSR
ncbi:MAG: DNA topoisomerase [Azospirillaceae bacterium]|nr:DNA topoisomerase [Azospirillaceae bacterium]